MIGIGENRDRCVFIFGEKQDEYLAVTVAIGGGGGFPREGL
jgi:hypothetical protein